MIIYLFWFVLVILLIFTVYLTWTLSFSVPLDVTDALFWLKIHQNFKLNFLYFLIFLIILFSILIYLTPAKIQFDPPLGHAPIFLLAASTLLLAAFFVEEGPNSNLRYVDSHPLIFYMAIFFLIMAVISGMVSSMKTLYYDL